MQRLRDRVAVITGAASGIGRALALELANRGCDLALVDLDEAGLEETGRRVRNHGRRASTHAADVAVRARMAELPDEVLREHKRVHILVNNAGVQAAGSFSEISIEDFQWVVDINFWGVVHGCMYFLPHLRQQDEAHIVNVSSALGLIGMPGFAAYSAGKFAVRGLSESLWTELADTDVGVTCVYPGGVRTNIARNRRTIDADDPRPVEFDRFARMAPEEAAKRIVRAIQRNKQRQLICSETYGIDWLKRALPNGTQRLVARVHRRRRRRAL